MQEWEWSERYPEQPEILRYLEHVAKRHDLKRDIQFDTSVTQRRVPRDDRAVDRAHRQGRRGHGPAISSRRWAACRLLNLPQFAGLETFKGKWFHTSQFPHGGVDFHQQAGRRRRHRRQPPCRRSRRSPSRRNNSPVFQRTANYCVPARNGKGRPRGHGGPQGGL